MSSECLPGRNVMTTFDACKHNYNLLITNTNLLKFAKLRLNLNILCGQNLTVLVGNFCGVYEYLVKDHCFNIVSFQFPSSLQTEEKAPSASTARPPPPPCGEGITRESLSVMPVDSTTNYTM